MLHLRLRKNGEGRKARISRPHQEEVERGHRELRQELAPELPIGEFLSRTSFEAYEDMPLFLKLGFAFGIFEQNTVFVPKRVS